MLPSNGAPVSALVISFPKGGPWTICEGTGEFVGTLSHGLLDLSLNRGRSWLAKRHHS